MTGVTKVHMLDTRMASASEMQAGLRSDRSERDGSPKCKPAQKASEEVMSSDSVAPAEAPKAQTVETFVTRCMRWFGAHEELAALKKQLAHVTLERDAAVAEADRWKRAATAYKTALSNERRGTVMTKKDAIKENLLADVEENVVAAPVPEDEDSDASIQEQGLAVLFQGLEVISSDLYMADMIDQIVKMVIQVLNCEKCTLFLADAEREELFVLFSADGSSIVEEMRLTFQTGLAGAAATGKQILNIADAYTDSRFNQEIDALTGFKTTSVLCVPLLDKDGKIVAVFQAINPLHGRPFGKRELQLCKYLQMPIAAALLNTRLAQSLRLAVERNKAMVRVSMVINTELNIPRLLNHVMQEARTLLQAERCTMYVCDHKKGELWSTVAEGFKGTIRVPIGQGIAGTCAQEGKVINVPDARTDPRIKKMGDFEIRHMLCVPIYDRRVEQTDRRNDSPPLTIGGAKAPRDRRNSGHAGMLATGMRRKSSVPNGSNRRMMGDKSSGGSTLNRAESSNGSIIVGVVQIMNKHGSSPFSDEDEAALASLCEVVSLAMLNAFAFEEMRDLRDRLSEVITSINSYVLTFTMDGLLESCNHPLRPLIGVDEASLQVSHFDEILVERGPGVEALRLHLKQCLGDGTMGEGLDVKIDLPTGDTAFMTYYVAPLIQQGQQGGGGLSTEEDEQVGVLLVLEDVSEMRRRQELQKELQVAEKRLAKMEEELSQLNQRAAQVTDTPLQKAIDSIKTLMNDTPNLQEPLGDVLTQLTSRDLLAPTLLTDDSKLDGMDHMTRDWLADQVGAKKALIRATQRGARFDRISMQVADDMTLTEVLDISSELTPMLMRSYKSWELDLYTQPVTPDQLVVLALQLFDALRVPTDFGISSAVLTNFVTAVRAGYFARPFHNFTHGVYCLHGCVVLIEQCALLKEVFTPTDRLALAVGALGHDIGHTGTNNAFLIASNDERALRYNDRSVLESMHCSFLFQVLQKPENGVLAGLEVGEYREVRRTIISAIYATDMANHFNDIAKFTNRIQSGQQWTSEDASDRQMLVEMVLHSADLSGPTRPWPISSLWAGLVGDEFSAQLDEEEQLGLPISTFMQAPKPKLEMNFIEFFVLPLYKALSSLLPEVEAQVAQIVANHERWGTLLGAAPKK